MVVPIDAKDPRPTIEPIPSAVDCPAQTEQRSDSFASGEEGLPASSVGPSDGEALDSPWASSDLENAGPFPFLEEDAQPYPGVGANTRRERPLGTSYTEDKAFRAPWASYPGTEAAQAVGHS